MKIAVYAIALNEAGFVRRFMASCQGADLVLVADTGSTDATVRLLTEAGAKVRPLRVDPWRFDVARNAAMAMLPDDVDVCIALDLDQTLPTGWRALVESAWTDGVDQLDYAHVYLQSGAGGGEFVFVDNRIHARTGFVWRYPCHECLIPLPGHSHQAVRVEQLRLLHAPDLDKPRGAYLPLLEMAVREAPDDARSAHYLGREYFQVGRYAEAALELQRHLTLSLATTSEIERNASVRLIGRCRENLGDMEGAMEAYRTAAAHRPRARGVWLELAWAHHRRAEWAPCLAAAEQAIALPAGAPAYGDDTTAGVVAEDLACLASWSLGRPQQALAYAKAARAKAPQLARLAANLRRIEAALAQSGPQSYGVSLTPLETDVRT
jgi:hypothetical protein